MSKKIYTVVVLLVVMALVIFGVSIYSLVTSARVAENMVTLGNRATALNEIDKQILQRTLLTRALNQTVDEKEIAGLINKDMVENNDAVQAAIKAYEANLPADADQAMRATTRELSDLWDVFVKESNTVGDLALENTNNKASRLNDENVPLWNGLDEDLSKLAESLRSQKEPEINAFAERVLRARTDLMHLRLFLVKYIHEPDAEIKAGYAAGIQEAIASVDKTFADVIAAVPAAKGGALAKKIFDETLVAKAQPLAKELTALVERNTNGLAMVQMAGPARDARVHMQEVTGEYLDTIERDQQAALGVVNQMEKQSLILMGAISVIGLGAMSILAWRIISGVVKRLNGIIGDLGSSSEKVQSASGQVSESSHTLADGASQQAASLEETSSALEQMASMTRQNADNASKTSNTMADTLKRVGSGSQTVHDVTSAMAAINESAEKIGNIIKTIEEIAFQTNLLALNAAVEAARAGEAGKGFAVVADEVRNLAQRSAQAAKDTSELIENAIERVRAGSENVDRLAEDFKNIEEASQEVGHLVTEISAATNEQAQGVDQVNTAVAQMDKVTQSNAASAEQSASAAEELSDQAAQMKIMVGDLISLVEGGKGNGLVRVPSSSMGPDEVDFTEGDRERRQSMLALPHAHS